MKTVIGILAFCASLFSQVTSIPAAASSATAGAVGGASNLTTVGAVPYVSATGVLNQDASVFFWDAANNRIGIGTNAPAFALDVSGSASTARIYDQTATTGSTLFQIRAGAGQSGDIFIVYANNGTTKLFYADQNGRPTANDAFFIGASGAVWNQTNAVQSHRSDGVISFASSTNATAAKDVGIGRAAAGVLSVTDGSSGFGRIRLIQSTPAASTDACTAGSIWTDASYIYACTASGAIKRATLNVF